MPFSMPTSMSIPYPTVPYEFYWGPVTAASNFCEEDYVVSPYIAEFINTLTNIVYVIYGIRGLYRLNGRVDILRALPFIGLIGVGIFSAIFHITLREWPQLGDDLSMAFPTAMVFCRLLTYRTRSVGMVVMVYTLVAGIMVGIYVVHIYHNGPVLHTVVFAVMICYIGLTTMRMVGTRVTDPRKRRAVARSAWFGAVMFVGGFALWIIDSVVCGWLNETKRWLGMPWAFVLELHGWWHIMTGIGAFRFISLVDYLTSDAVLMDGRVDVADKLK